MIEKLKGNFFPTAIGSLPYKDSRIACDKILRNFKEIPFWPQLVRRSFFENMYVQFSEKLPCVIVDVPNKRLYVDTQKDLSQEIEVIYDKFLKDDVGYFSISRDYSEGLYGLLDALKQTGAKPKFLKGQITGPVSFGLTVTDEKKRSLFYNAQLRETLVKILSMRARWQIRKLKEIQTDCIIFIDEPYLTSMGSSFVSLNEKEARLCLDEVIEAIHKEDALCGIHCCGNTDWDFLLATGIDILSFDAYTFYESISLYPKELDAFLKRNGILAWGLIPNTEEVLKQNPDSLAERLEKALVLLAKKGIKREAILDAMLITPSCGFGLVEEDLADAIIEKTVDFSKALREKY